MDFLTIVTEPAILIITALFIFFLTTVLKNYIKTEKNLKSVAEFLKEFNKKELSYRFNQLDECMVNNSYTATIWEDFKKALIFPDKLYSANQVAKINTGSEVYLTIDSSYFFNEECLIYSNINHKFIQIIPTLLTGLGPFFTFL